MTPVAEFELEVAAERSGKACCGRLIHRGREWELPAPGSELEAQFRCARGYLLMVSEGTPYEDALHLLLIEPGGSLIDRVELSHPYAPGLLRELRLAGEEQLEFGFFGEDLWRLIILERPARWPLARREPGVHRGWRQWLHGVWLDLRRLR